MRAFAHRLTAILLLPAFGLIVAGGQGWHLLLEHGADCCHHGHCHASREATPTRGCGGSDACSRHAHSHSASNHCEASHDGTRPEAGPGLARHPHDFHNCPVCQFFSQLQQVPLAVTLDGEPATCDPLLVRSDGVAPREPMLGYRSRAPPLAF